MPLSILQEGDLHLLVPPDSLSHLLIENRIGGNPIMVSLWFVNTK